MTIADRWLLPDGVEDILPPKAEKIETLRAKLLGYTIHGALIR